MVASNTNLKNIQNYNGYTYKIGKYVEIINAEQKYWN